MKNYSIVIVGASKEMQESNYPKNLINNVTQFISYYLYKYFKKLSHVKCLLGTKEIEDLPKTDILLWCSYTDLLRQSIHILKKQYKHIYTVFEIPFENCNGGVCFAKKTSLPINYTFFPLPCEKEIYKNIDKIPNSILIDHDWNYHNGKNRSFNPTVEEWLKELSYCSISRLIRLNKEFDFCPKYINPIKQGTLKEYLERTNTFENFIVTQPESYGYGVIDMIARGIRVIAPADYLPSVVVTELKIPTFNNKEELLNIIKSPINKDYYNNLINLTTPYSKIVEYMDNKIQGDL